MDNNNVLLLLRDVKAIIEKGRRSPANRELCLAIDVYRQELQGEINRKLREENIKRAKEWDKSHSIEDYDGKR